MQQENATEYQFVVLKYNNRRKTLTSYINNLFYANARDRRNVQRRVIWTEP